jgi:hypothetical protein
LAIALFHVQLARAADARVAAQAGHSDEDLAKKLANPCVNLVSVPLQENVDLYPLTQRVTVGRASAGCHSRNAVG